MSREADWIELFPVTFLPDVVLFMNLAGFEPTTPTFEFVHLSHCDAVPLLQLLTMRKWSLIILYRFCRELRKMKSFSQYATATSSNSALWRVKMGVNTLSFTAFSVRTVYLQWNSKDAANSDQSTAAPWTHLFIQTILSSSYGSHLVSF